jgi:transposase
LVDLETRQPIELLSDRTASTLAEWLQEHPGVEIISRDRAKAYKEGASKGQVNRLKTLKRQMYGCASHELLKRRFLCPV